MFADLLRLRIFINSKYNVILWLVRLTIATVGTQDVPCVSLIYLYHCPKCIQGVSGGIVNVLGGGSMDYSE